VNQVRRPTNANPAAGGEDVVKPIAGRNARIVDALHIPGLAA
jgi:hypothetical protein